MNERERAVDNLITKARYAAGVYAVLPPESRKPHEHDLKVAVDRFLEADALDAAPGLKWGCRVVKALDEHWDIVTPDMRYFLARAADADLYWEPLAAHLTMGHHISEGEWNTESAALAALDACTTPPPGVEPADDPQATPAAETVIDLEPADRSPNVQEQLDDLASRVAEVERQVIHESRCRVELEGGMESMHLRFTDQIAALRRDVEALKGNRSEPVARRAYPCGCLPCMCEDEERCHGCGAKNCGKPDCARKAECAAPPAPTEQAGADARSLPFGCVAHQHEDGRWTIKNKGLTHYWDHVQNEWMADTSPEDGGFNSDTEALYYFRATNKGVAPPGEASIESRVTHFDSEPTTPTGSEYEVEMCPHNVNKNRVVHDGLFMLIQNGHIRWTSDAWTPLDRVDAETIAAVLRNAQ